MTFAVTIALGADGLFEVFAPAAHPLPSWVRRLWVLLSAALAVGVGELHPRAVPGSLQRQARPVTEEHGGFG